MLVKDLRKIAKEKGVKGYWKLRKAELIELLKSIPAPGWKKSTSNSGSKTKKKKTFKG